MHCVVLTVEEHKLGQCLDRKGHTLHQGRGCLLRVASDMDGWEAYKA